MIVDDNTLLLPSWAKIILSDPQAAKFVSGIGVHWYTRHFSGYGGISKSLKYFPKVFSLGTEACNGFLIWDKNVDLGSWERGEEYGMDIIQQLLHGSSGWTDWNLALDLQGGPNWANLGADAPIIVDSKKEEILKQPMFYFLAHFSKFFTRGSNILRSKVTPVEGQLRNPLMAVAVKRPDGFKSVVLMNRNEEPVTVDLFEINKMTGKRLEFLLTPRSVGTLLYI